MVNPIKAIQDAQKYLQLLQDLQKMDEDGNGIADAVDYMNDAKELSEDVKAAKALAAKVQARVDKMTERFGGDIDAIREKLGIVDEPGKE